MSIYSGEGQDDFVISVLNGKKNGTYLEIGGYHSKDKSTTFLLEDEYDWSGFALEIDKERSAEYNLNRKNKCLNQDAIMFDYAGYLKENNYPKQIDYLSLDIDEQPHNANLLGLLALPLLQYRFSVITIEHNVVNDILFESLRKTQRDILRALDYKLITPRPCEDWWIDPRVVPQENFVHHLGNGF